MANVKFSRKEFEKQVGKLDEKMQEKISLFGTPFEQADNETIEIEIFPNRPDLLSFQNYVRSFKAFLGRNTGLKKYLLKKENYEVNVDKSVEKIRPFTACAVVKGINFNDEKIKEIIDLQEKLQNTLGRKRKKIAIGIYPMEKIKFPIKYTALEPDKIKFQPLEFPREINGLQILQQHPTGREYAGLLAGKEKFPLFIDANNEVLSMPPIINSHKTGKISLETTDVFIECSGFDFEILKKCLNIIVVSLAEMQGIIYEVKVNYKKPVITPDFTTEKMKLNTENVKKLLGLELNEKDIKKYIEMMGHEYDKGFVEIAPWRTDILHEVDLIEEIAIAYGFDKIEPLIPKISTIAEESKETKIKSKISEVLTGLGLLEISTHHLVKNDEIDEKDKDIVEILESKTDFRFMRKNLMNPMLRTLSENVDNEYPQKLFEIGRVFRVSDDKEIETGVEEEDKLIVSLTPGNFTDIKQLSEYFGKMLNLELKIEALNKENSEFIDGRVGELKLNNKSIGIIGEIHPRVLKKWKLKMPLALMEISLKEIFDGLK